MADKIGTNQNAVYRAENPNYGKQTITTLKKIAAAFDVALVVRFAPFSELLDWVNGTPRTIAGLTTAALEVSSFIAEDEAGAFDATKPVGAASMEYREQDGTPIFQKKAQPSLEDSQRYPDDNLIVMEKRPPQSLVEQPRATRFGCAG